MARISAQRHRQAHREQASDIAVASDLLEGHRARAVLADKGYDGNDLRRRIAAMKAQAVIPSKRTRKAATPYDQTADKHRSQIARCFNRLDC